MISVSKMRYILEMSQRKQKTLKSRRKQSQQKGNRKEKELLRILRKTFVVGDSHKSLHEPRHLCVVAFVPSYRVQRNYED